VRYIEIERAVEAEERRREEERRKQKEKEHQRHILNTATSTSANGVDDN